MTVSSLGSVKFPQKLDVEIKPPMTTRRLSSDERIVKFVTHRIDNRCMCDLFTCFLTVDDFKSIPPQKKKNVGQLKEISKMPIIPQNWAVLFNLKREKKKIASDWPGAIWKKNRSRTTSQSKSFFDAMETEKVEPVLRRYLICTVRVRSDCRGNGTWLSVKDNPKATGIKKLGDLRNTACANLYACHLFKGG